MLTALNLVNGNHNVLAYYVLIAYVLHHGAAKSRDKEKCEKVTLYELSGRIASPNVTNGKYVMYPNLLNCAWYIKVPSGMILTLSFRLFDIEEGHQLCDGKPCCNETFVSITSVSNRFTASSVKSNGIQDNVNLIYCGRNLPIPPLFFSGSGLIITFRSGFHIQGGRGFIIDYLIEKKVKRKCDPHQHRCANGKCILTDWLCNGWDECGDSSDEQGCTHPCKIGMTRCSSNNTVCFDYNRDRCNGIVDCPDGEDEEACAYPCKNPLMCRVRGGCYNPLQRCDGIRDCIDGSDEEECDSTLCGPHRNGFLCRNRRCVSALMRCDGVQDCGDYSDEETCMKMSVVTAGILGSLLCGLLLVIALGCGLRLYRLRVALEQRWTAIRQHHIINSDFDEFGRRRPIMGRLPPPTYAQAMGNALPINTNVQISVPGTTIPRYSSHRSRRHSRRSRRPAPLPPPVPSQIQPPVDENGPVSIRVAPEEQDSITHNGFIIRVLQRWRKRLVQPSETPQDNELATPVSSAPLQLEPPSTSEAEQPARVLVLDHVQAAFQTSEAMDTDPLLESRP